MSETSDIVIFRTGNDSFTGRVNNPSFDIVTVEGPKLTIATNDIGQIHFKNLPYYRTDEILGMNGDKYAGTIQTASVDFTLYNGQKMDLPVNIIHTIFFRRTFDRTAPRPPAKT